VEIDPKTLSAEASYKLVTGMVVPRPIAWVTTLGTSGVVNLAPFSAFTYVAPHPPMLGISVGRKREDYKDTGRNILTTEEFVVHIADQPLIEPLHRSAIEYPSDESEVEALGLETLPSKSVKPPRLAAAQIAMECRFRHCIEFGASRSRFIVGEVILIHVRDGLFRDGKIDTAALNPIARLAGPRYATLGEMVTMPEIYQTPKN
jgi:flavin reductase (DIM6/NTAB) family NADH-FMN oxidoreductase RutF